MSARGSGSRDERTPTGGPWSAGPGRDERCDPRTPALAAAALALLALLAASGWAPHDRATWLLEVLPVVVVLPLLAATHRRHPLTTLLYALVFAHCCVLMLGGTHTYARVPLGFWLQDALGLARNPYDRIGHFFQGLVPAIAAREILLRGEHVRGARMLAFLVVCVVLAISASYELIEWGVAVAIGQDADAFLGTQGDPWDTQADMATAGVGALVALATLSRLHDAGLRRLPRARALGRRPESCMRDERAPRDAPGRAAGGDPGRPDGRRPRTTRKTEHR